MTKQLFQGNFQLVMNFCLLVEVFMAQKAYQTTLLKKSFPFLETPVDAESALLYPDDFSLMA